LQLRHRRICRKPEPVQLSEPAVAAAAASGLLAAANPDDDAAAATAGAPAGDSAEAADADRPLPSQVVEQLLLERYSTKYERMGLPEKMPGRRKWQSLQQEQRNRSPSPVLPQNAMQQAAAAASAAAAGSAPPDQGEVIAGGAAEGASAQLLNIGAATEACGGVTLPPLKPAAQT
jgi:hypothetical protein